MPVLFQMTDTPFYTERHYVGGHTALTGEPVICQEAVRRLPASALGNHATVNMTVLITRRDGSHFLWVYTQK